MQDPPLVVAQTFTTHLEADLAKGALESAGIDALLQADDLGGLRPDIALTSSGFKLLVAEADAESARQILAATTASAPEIAE